MAHRPPSAPPALPAPDTALVCRAPGETRVALSAAGEILELHLFRDHALAPGDLFLGRVRGRVPGVPAAFVDIGDDRPAFLPEEDCPAGLPAEGAAVIVEVALAARAEKGAKLTAKVSVPGDRLVLSPFRPGVGVSGKIRDAKARAAFTRWGEAALEEGEGVVIRSLCRSLPEATLAAALDPELAALRDRWRALRAAAEAARPPCRLASAQAPLAAALAGRPVAVVLCEGAGMAEAARAARPDLAEAVRAVPGAGLFAAEGGDEALEAALADSVPLGQGATLRIEETAAVTALDVDTGRLPPEEANARALREAARQIRLRNLAGMIVIDFAAPRHGAEAARKALAEALRGLLRSDPARPQVVGVSGLGLIEVRRPRGRPPLADLLLGRRPRRRPLPDTVALEALRQVLAAARATPGARPELTVAPPVAAVLDGALREARAEAERALGHRLAVSARPGAAVDLIEIRP
jgi:Rne/Rng family ribonuclease